VAAPPRHKKPHVFLSGGNASSRVMRLAAAPGGTQHRIVLACGKPHARGLTRPWHVLALSPIRCNVTPRCSAARRERRPHGFAAPCSPVCAFVRICYALSITPRVSPRRHLSCRELGALAPLVLCVFCFLFRVRVAGRSATSTCLEQTGVALGYRWSAVPEGIEQRGCLLYLRCYTTCLSTYRALARAARRVCRGIAFSCLPFCYSPYAAALSYTCLFAAAWLKGSRPQSRRGRRTEGRSGRPRRALTPGAVELSTPFISRVAEECLLTIYPVSLP